MAAELATKTNAPLIADVKRIFNRQTLVALGIHIASPMLFQAARAASTRQNKRRLKMAAAGLHLLDGYLMWKGVGD